MIEIKDKKECCGCEACVQACPVSCISFEVDNEGFRYPKVNLDLCINCGKCERVCPELNVAEPREPIECYAAWNNDEDIRMKSSSGGVFSALAESVIAEGGVVFGARFDENWQVVHDYTATVEGLAAFRGSKYVQSRIGNTFKQALDFLKQGRKVMFTGTPCQIAALNRFVGKKYDNLLTVDIACHSVPSPLVWDKYLKYKPKGTVCFRDKSDGWQNYRVVIGSYKRQADQDNYMRLFINGYISRPSCTVCPAKSGKSNSDITICDFWGIEKEMPELVANRGISGLIIYSPNIALTGKSQLFNKLSLLKTTYNAISKHNAALTNAAVDSPYKNNFWNNFHHRARLSFFKYGSMPIILRIKIVLAKILRR